MSNKQYYVYLHYVKNSEHPFYVGASSTKERAYNFSARSSDWHKIYLLANKNIEVVLHPVSTKIEANQLETRLINEHKQYLCNTEKSKPLPTTELIDINLIKVASELGTTIKILRLKRGLKTKDLAKLAGLSQPTINKIEAGETRSSMTAYINIFHVLGCITDLTAVGQDQLGGVVIPVKIKESNLYNGLSKKKYLALLK